MVAQVVVGRRPDQGRAPTTVVGEVQPLRLRVGGDRQHGVGVLVRRFDVVGILAVLVDQSRARGGEHGRVVGVGDAQLEGVVDFCPGFVAHPDGHLELIHVPVARRAAECARSVPVVCEHQPGRRLPDDLDRAAVPCVDVCRGDAGGELEVFLRTLILFRVVPLGGIVGIGDPNHELLHVLGSLEIGHLEGDGPGAHVVVGGRAGQGRQPVVPRREGQPAGVVAVDRQFVLEVGVGGLDRVAVLDVLGRVDHCGRHERGALVRVGHLDLKRLLVGAPVAVIGIDGHVVHTNLVVCRATDDRRGAVTIVGQLQPVRQYAGRDRDHVTLVWVLGRHRVLEVKALSHPTRWGAGDLGVIVGIQYGQAKLLHRLRVGTIRGRQGDLVGADLVVARIAGQRCRHGASLRQGEPVRVGPVEGDVLAGVHVNDGDAVAVRVTLGDLEYGLRCEHRHVVDVDDRDRKRLRDAPAVAVCDGERDLVGAHIAIGRRAGQGHQSVELGGLQREPRGQAVGFDGHAVADVAVTRSHHVLVEAVLGRIEHRIGREFGRVVNRPHGDSHEGRLRIELTVIYLKCERVHSEEPVVRRVGDVGCVTHQFAVDQPPKQDEREIGFFDI